jgi:hypothetical protein
MTAGAKSTWAVGVTGAATDVAVDDSTGVIPAFGGEVTEDLGLPAFSKLDADGNFRSDEEDMK